MALPALDRREDDGEDEAEAEAEADDDEEESAEAAAEEEAAMECDDNDDRGERRVDASLPLLRVAKGATAAARCCVVVLVIGAAPTRPAEAARAWACAMGRDSREREREWELKRERFGRQREKESSDLLARKKNQKFELCFVELEHFLSFFSPLFLFFPFNMSASLRSVAGAPLSRASSSRAASQTMTVGCPAMPAMANASPRRNNPVALVGMRRCRLASPSSVSAPPRAVRADAPTETLDSATVDAISAVTAKANEAHAAALARAKEEAASWQPAAAADASSLRAKVLNSVADVQQGLLEREVEVRDLRTEIVFLSTFKLEREKGWWQGKASVEDGETDWLMASKEKHWLGPFDVEENEHASEREETRFFFSLNLILFFLSLQSGGSGERERERASVEWKRASERDRKRWPLCLPSRERKREAEFFLFPHPSKKPEKLKNLKT